nr:zinc ribbon domain-containing protein [Halorientalis persicus]
MGSVGRRDVSLLLENGGWVSQAIRYAGRCACGFTHEDNRDDKAFECQSCGYELNADYNAAKNIANRYCGYIHRGQKSRDGWGTSQLALKSGTLNVNGEYTPAELLG